MTQKQVKCFWAAFGAACRELGIIDAYAREQYRREVMWNEARARHLADVSPTSGYEAVMTRLHADAGDLEAASRMAIGDARRMAAMIDDCARQMFELDGRSGGPDERAAYARAILAQSGVEAPAAHGARWWLDYPEETFMRVFYSLDSHRRRLVSRRAAESGGRLRVRYTYGATWA